MRTHLLSVLAQILVTIRAAVGDGVLNDTPYEARPVDLSDHQSTLGPYSIIPGPPHPEPIRVVEIALPPVSASRKQGACSRAINPRGTGCIAQDLRGEGGFQSGDFTPDGKNVIATVEFVGAPAAPHPASIYSGLQVILIKADGTKFSNGDSWKCLSCAIRQENMIAVDPKKDYPHVFRTGDRAIWGHNILECGGKPLSSDACTPARTHIYPIFWTDGAPRELRVHPDDVHIGWSSFTDQGGQACFFGRLQFNTSPTKAGPQGPRYELVNVNLLADPKSRQFVTAKGNELHLHPESITVGELRGFSGTGDEIIYLGAPTESNNLDLYAVHVQTAVVRRLTSHPDYADPVAFSADDKWLVVQDTRATERQMWMAGMRGLPPLIDIVAITAAASTRNNGHRRFFQPVLIDRHGDRDAYFGQQMNAGDRSQGGVGDPNWNGRADPAFSLDGTKVVYWQSIVASPSCGGSNPLQCPKSTAQGGREYRIMLAHLTSRNPRPPRPIYKIPDQIPWATRFVNSTKPSTKLDLVPGNYTLQGMASGKADVQLIGVKSIDRVVVHYVDYSADGLHVVNGWEDVEASIIRPDVWRNRITWHSDILQTGIVNGSKKTSPGGFHLEIDAMANVFRANGSLTTTLDGIEYHQPVNEC